MMNEMKILNVQEGCGIKRNQNQHKALNQELRQTATPHTATLKSKPNMSKYESYETEFYP